MTDAPLALPPGPVVVTGAAGWLGSALMAALGGGHQGGIAAADGPLRVLVHRASDVAVVADLAPDAEVFVGDVADRAVLARLFDGVAGATVIHSAGVIHPTRVVEWHHTNVEGTRAVLDAAAAAGSRVFVHVSSNSPFGVNPTPDDVFRNEEPYRPYLGYGSSKMDGELLVKEAQVAGRLDTVIVRPPWFYGPYQPARQVRFLTMVRTGKFPLVDPTARRSLVHVENLVQGVVRAASTPSAVGHGYWIADAEIHPMADVVDTIRRALVAEGLPLSKRVALRLPSAVSQVAERVDGVLQNRGRYVQELHVLGEMNKTIACDISVARADLGYEPTVTLYDGMRQSIRWCLDRGMAV